MSAAVDSITPSQAELVEFFKSCQDRMTMLASNIHELEAMKARPSMTDEERATVARSINRCQGQHYGLECALIYFKNATGMSPAGGI